MDLRLKGKVALVTGAGSQVGFGKATCLLLAAEGCDIIAADLDLPGAEKTAAEVIKLGRQAIAVKCNITLKADCQAMAKIALDKFGKVDILVNNAGGIAAQGGPFEAQEETAWDKNYALNLTVNVKLHSVGFPYGYLTAWIDKNQDGVWENNDERVFYRVMLEPGDNLLTLYLFNTSLGATYARFQLSLNSQEELTPTGLSSGGEVEDYRLEIIDPPVADLAVSATGLPASTQPGSEFTYQITATNNGPNDATGIEVSDTLLMGATLKSSNFDAGSFDSSTGLWSGFGLLHGQSAHLNLTVIVDSPPSDPTLYYDMKIEGMVMDPVSNNDYYEGEISFGPQQGVGGEVVEPDRLRLILPWLAFTAIMLLAGTTLVLRRNRK